MKSWATRVMAFCVLGTSSALAGDGPKLEPPARPTRSEVEGSTGLSAGVAENPPALGGAPSPIVETPTRLSPGVGLAPIYRPAAPPMPRLLPSRPLATGAEETQAALPPALEGPRALTLETVPDPSEFDLKPLAETTKPLERRERRDIPPAGVEPEPRRRGLFGLFRSGPNLERIEPAPRNRLEGETGRSMSRSDPAADTALRQKVESQADRALGRHLRELDVRVMDQKIIIRARADFFWNRRGIRKVLGTLSAIQGHQTTIEVD